MHSDTKNNGRARSGRWDVAVLLLVFGVLMGFRLGAWPLVNPDEGRYAEIPREMVATGDWVTPRLDGVAYFEKPPLVYWLVAGCYRAFGPGEASMRLMPMLFALGGVLLTYGCARRIYGREAGLLAAAALGTMIFYAGMARALTLDMVVSVLMSTALFCFILALRELPGRNRRLLFYGVYASAALATLAKGLIGFLIPGAILFLWLLIFNQWRRLRPLYLPTGALLFALIAVPWHMLAALRNPGWAWFYFVHEHWLRFTTETHGRVEPWWYFMPILLLGLFPWCGFVWPALKRAWRKGCFEEKAADRWFFVVWIGFILGFFSLSDSKLAPYILPVFPAVAVLVGDWLAETRVQRGAPFAWRGGLWVFAGVSLVLGVGFAVVLAKPDVARLGAAQMETLRPTLIALVGVLLAGAASGWWAAHRGSPCVALVAMLATGMLFMVGFTYVAPYTLRPGTKAMATLVDQEIGPGGQVFCYHEFFHDFTYYSEHVIGTVGYEGELAYGIAHTTPEDRRRRFIDDAEFVRRWAGQERLFVIVRKRDLPDFESAGLGQVYFLLETRGHKLFSNQP